MEESSIRRRILWNKLFKVIIILLTFSSILPMFFIKMFTTPKDKKTEKYLSGKFG